MSQAGIAVLVDAPILVHHTKSGSYYAGHHVFGQTTVGLRGGIIMRLVD